MTTEIEYFVREESHAIATWRDVVVIASRLDSPLAAAASMRKASTQLRRRYPQGFGHLTIVEPGCKSPSAEARTEAARVVTEFSDVLKGTAIVFLGSGLRGAFVRAVVASLMALSRSPTPHQVCESVSEGAFWLAGKLPGLDGRGLASAAELVRKV